jgi:hypothetical protein
MIGFQANFARIYITRLNETNIQKINPIPGVTNCIVLGMLDLYLFKLTFNSTAVPLPGAGIQQ